MIWRRWGSVMLWVEGGDAGGRVSVMLWVKEVIWGGHGSVMWVEGGDTWRIGFCDVVGGRR